MNLERLNEIEKPLLQIVKNDVVPALGCTEPISLAFASATTAKYLGKKPEHIEAKVSPNLMKNGLGVAVPGTGMVRLPIAAAIGALGGNPDGGLEVLKHITPEQVTAAKNMLEQKLVSVPIAIPMKSSNKLLHERFLNFPMLLN
ncbi:Serine dehydratase alpha chain [Haemophilus influenzae]|nr:Serine dehydratase alpha chain [Haemophilus influenzae]PRI87111.1 Serine dehydratase alpha chain [Haemophilus influenzae]PRJ90201.1 Serine dehydratase alpha chain [Haemophilus influenzae]PRK61428.1 Serine dehydratase alpha chain [Haemophilus influenzae]PRL86881.1 Serine dehydratase alpha chain [Haemophilus influenzae]